MRRHARLTTAGVLVLHFSPRQIRTEPGEVVTAIWGALRAGRPAAGIRAEPAGS
jgi:very-short-patch-repair endonuclease